MANHEVSLQCGYLISHGRGWLDVAVAPALCPATVRDELEFLWMELCEDEVAAGAKSIRDDAQLVGGEAAPRG